MFATPNVNFALDIVDYKSPTNDRFSSGYPLTPVQNNSPSFLGKDFDLSGIGWSATNPDQNFTMINDRQFVMLSHYPAASDMIHFYSPAFNSIVVYHINPKGRISLLDSSSGQKIDLQIGTLTKPLNPADRITHYPILELSQPDDYLNLKLLVYGHAVSGGTSPVVGINKLEEIMRGDHYSPTVLPAGDDINHTTVFIFRQGADTSGAWAESGDSAAPTFTAINGRLYLLGVHLKIHRKPHMTIDIFLPAYLDSLTKAGVSFRK